MPQLIFVYNADAGLLNGLLDLAHKMISPTTYPCSLCAITYGTRMRPEWKSFIDSLPLESQFLHRDEFSAVYPWLAQERLPAVFLKDDFSELHSFITAEELNKADLAGLKHLVQQRLQLVPQRPRPRTSSKKV
ncbi:hypothetical protein LGH70_06170 [Hymenobacter sp. BT635]|uniref:GTPase n=1 Tax=Hymenobacter nitidus TaxID=2880929 RepID=A0ABS8AAB8_9BACT|nr:hypothetical protein [Hymenobacter nitidus]MCB2377159.1 hypothetical protein [Hymenobacter nitidus]